MSDMTERIFHADARTTTFSARVLARRNGPDGVEVRLDRTAFYAASGGQPHDTGRLGASRVLDVYETDDGALWHRLDSDVADEVQGVIDWERRFDHMQQHSGQHILSQAFLQTSGAETVSFHLGAERVTIDLAATEPGSESLLRAEERANLIVQEDREIRTHWTTRADVHRFPLRKPPLVDGAIRVVEIDDFDWSACGGTHVARTGSVGLIKILGSERYKGGTRLEFVCGGRALRDYGWKHAALQDLAGRFSTLDREVPGLVVRMNDDNRDLRRRLRERAEADLDREAARLAAEAAPLPAGKVVRLVREVDDVEFLKGLASRLRRAPGVLALLGGRTPDGRAHLVLARADDLGADMNQTLRAVLALIQGRGGGRPEMAQGSGPKSDGLEAALDAALTAATDPRTGRA